MIFIVVIYLICSYIENNPLQISLKIIFNSHSNLEPSYYWNLIYILNIHKSTKASEFNNLFFPP